MALALSFDFDLEPEVEINTPQSRQHHAPTLEELLLGIDLDTLAAATRSKDCWKTRYCSEGEWKGCSSSLVEGTD
jgi:hypothetical protein